MQLRIDVRPLSAFALLFGLAACGGDEAKTPATLTNVEAMVFTPSCSLSSSCHTGASPAGGLNLDANTHGALIADSTEVPGKKRVAPGNPDASYLMDKLLNRNLPSQGPNGEIYTSMPPGVTLEADLIDLVRRWIQAGALDD
jgi:hypothetical protein